MIARTTRSVSLQPLDFAIRVTRSNKDLREMASSVASALNAIARDSGFGDSEVLSGFIADYFGDSDNEFDSGETRPPIFNNNH